MVNDATGAVVVGATDPALTENEYTAGEEVTPAPSSARTLKV